jgi:hypothetical protein
VRTAVADPLQAGIPIEGLERHAKAHEAPSAGDQDIISAMRLGHNHNEGAAAPA